MSTEYASSILRPDHWACSAVANIGGYPQYNTYNSTIYNQNNYGASTAAAYNPFTNGSN